VHIDSKFKPLIVNGETEIAGVREGSTYIITVQNDGGVEIREL